MSSTRPLSETADCPSEDRAPGDTAYRCGCWLAQALPISRRLRAENARLREAADLVVALYVEVAAGTGDWTDFGRSLQRLRAALGGGE